MGPTSTGITRDDAPSDPVATVRRHQQPASPEPADRGDLATPGTQGAPVGPTADGHLADSDASGSAAEPTADGNPAAPGTRGAQVEPTAAATVEPTAAALAGTADAAPETPTAPAATPAAPVEPTAAAPAGTADAAPTRSSLPRAAPRRTARSRRRRHDASSRRTAYLVGACGLGMVVFALRGLVPSAPSGPGPTTATAVAADVNNAASALGTAEGAITACPPASTPAGLACVEAQDLAMAGTLGTLLHDLSATKAPAAARPQLTQLESTVGRFAADLNDLAEASSSASYHSIAANADIAPLGKAMASQASALVTSLRRS